MRRLLLALLFVVVLLPGPPVIAQPSPRQIGERDAVTLAPARAYIFYRSPQKATLLFVRIPNEADRAEHAVARTAALARAQEAQRRRRVLCQPDPSAQRCRRLLAEPALTDESFDYPPVLDRNLVLVARNPPFSTETNNSYTYLVEVPPGRYVFYGQTDVAANVGLCLCMGSLSFEVPAGQIIDLGSIAALTIQANLSDPALPARLSGLPVTRADYRAAGKMPNFLSLYIGRHPEVPGVLRYERDVVIDARSGAGVGPVFPAAAP